MLLRSFLAPDLNLCQTTEPNAVLSVRLSVREQPFLVVCSHLPFNALNAAASAAIRSALSSLVFYLDPCVNGSSRGMACLTNSSSGLSSTELGNISHYRSVFKNTYEPSKNVYVLSDRKDFGSTCVEIGHIPVGEHVLLVVSGTSHSKNRSGGKAAVTISHIITF